jgi:hypothetical protein
LEKNTNESELKIVVDEIKGRLKCAIYLNGMESELDYSLYWEKKNGSEELVGLSSISGQIDFSIAQPENLEEKIEILAKGIITRAHCLNEPLENIINGKMPYFKKEIEKFEQKEKIVIIRSFDPSYPFYFNSR